MRPTACEACTPSSRSSGPMNISKQSRNSALARPTTAAISVFASVLITSGRTPSSTRLLVDLLDRILRLLDRVHERQGDLVESHLVELGEQAVAEHFGRDAGAVGHEKGGALLASL